MTTKWAPMARKTSAFGAITRWAARIALLAGLLVGLLGRGLILGSKDKEDCRLKQRGLGSSRM